MNLSKRAKNITSEYDETRSGKTVQEMKQLVSRLPYMMALKKQLSTCNHPVINFTWLQFFLNILKDKNIMF
jgi:hypothetical protein